MNELIYEIFDNIPRQGPGDDEFTRKAYHLIPALPPDPKIVDIGCGTGMQTLELARNCFGKVTGIDNHQPYVDDLNRKIADEGIENCHALVGDMFDLDFDYESIDLIWSEGAIYIMGFENGLIQWKKYLKPGGYLVVSEIAWFEEHRPAELKEFWEKEVPGMLTKEEQVQIIENCGYELIEAFPLPSEAWWQNFYEPLQERINRLKDKYADDSEALKDIYNVQTEITIHKKYSDYYGYIFYVMRRKEVQ